MKFRLAKKSDINSLARVHLECGKVQPDSFMHLLGITFMKTYYKILLNEKSTVVVVAEDQNGIIPGFCSGSLASEEHLAELKSKKLRMSVALIPALIKSPRLLGRLLSHNRFIDSAGSNDSYGISKGGRCEYWGWMPTSNKNPGMSILLFKIWLKIVFNLGCKSVKGEVDAINKSVIEMHKALGAEIINETILPDGRKRIFYEHKI